MSFFSLCKSPNNANKHICKDILEYKYTVNVDIFAQLNFRAASPIMVRVFVFLHWSIFVFVFFRAHTS